MLEQVSNFDQEIKFILGFAGSGKSTRLAKAATESTLVLTPTHKAAAVLISKGVQNVFTIHSVLKLAPTLDQSYNPSKGQKLQKLRKIGSCDLAEVTDVFIDEFSMISQYILDLLLSVLPEHAKVTVFGDPYQLPPIQGEAIDPLIYTDNIEELTTQHRAEAPEVVETFMRFMHYIKGGEELDLTLNKSISTGTLDEFNPDTDRILAFTNAKVSELNSEVSLLLELDAEYEAGDELVLNSIPCVYAEDGWHKLFPNCISKGRLLDTSALRQKVDKTERDIAKYSTESFLTRFSTGYVEVNDCNYVIYYDTEFMTTQKELKNDIEHWQSFLYINNDVEEGGLKAWCKENSNASGVRERGRAWANYMTHSNLVFNLQRPYATTVHKAQGSEFSTVFIAQKDIKKAIRNGYYMAYARLMYVALSRAVSKVVIV